MSDLRNLPQDLTGLGRKATDFREFLALPKEVGREPVISTGAELRLCVAGAGIQVRKGGTGL